MPLSSRKRNKQPLTTGSKRCLTTNGNGNNEDDDIVSPHNEHCDTGNDISVPEADTSSITQSAQPAPPSFIII